ncbi:MAG: hypothetical protein PHH21_03375 [Candidatus Pacebacteria bacterium]|nr:hypothetical protein [Candidatus Paceibacterota bacterium]
MNKKLIFILIITVLAFSLSIYQYVREFQPEFATAVYSGKPAVSHSWSEMECSEGFCVTSDNKVGIGTSTPAAKLDVTGTINSTGNISSSGAISATGNISSAGTITAATNVCIGSGACLSDLDGFIGSQNLIYSAHTFDMCSTTPDSNGYGEVTNIGTTSSPVYICKFDSSSCPAGINGQPLWIQYSSYAKRGPTTCYQGSPGGCYGDGGQYPCTTGSTDFVNGPDTLTCQYCAGSSRPCGDYGCCVCYMSTCTSAITQIGCY